MPTGDWDGPRIASIPGRSIICAVVPAGQLEKAEKCADELGKSCVYVMLGRNLLGHPLAYVGESHEGLYNRQRQKDHGSRREEYCDRILAFYRQSPELDGTTLKYIESRIIEAIDAAGSATLENRKRVPSEDREKSMSRTAVGFAKRVIDDIEILVPILGEPSLLYKPPEIQKNSETYTLKNSIPYGNRKQGKDGKLVVSQGKYVVLEGSGSLEPSSSLPAHLKLMRDDLISTGVIKLDNDGKNGVFTKHHAFVVPSNSAKIVRGTSVSKGEWRTADGGRL